MDRPVVVASNRGPVTFELRADQLVATRGSGGLVSGLGPIIRSNEIPWFSAALTEGDRKAAESGERGAGFETHVVDIDPDVIHLAYNKIANETLWYLYHGMFDRAREPVIDIEWYDAWSAFRSYNHAFADALIEHAPPNSIVLLQDHHLALVGPKLRDERPDSTVVHFSHTPFATPDALRILPELARTELLLGYLGCGALGFHSSRWSENFVACCRDTLGVRPTKTFVSPLGTDAEELRAFSQSPGCEAELASLEEEVGTRYVIGRAERLEPSKNLLRGIWAYDELLAMRADLHGNVVFVANFSPTRTQLGDYLAYRAELEEAIEVVNARWGTDDWRPVSYRIESSYARTVAIFRRYDVLLINPIRDGLNLVATEGPLVNERNGVVLLSREAGSYDDLGGLASEVHPYDISQTAQAMSDALDMPEDVRADLHADLVEIALSRSPLQWLDEQVEAANQLGDET